MLGLLNRNLIRFHLLKALKKHGPGYGLEIKKRVKATGAKVTLGQGELYPTLRDMERDGFVTVEKRKGPPERGGRSRYYYKITKSGNAFLEDNSPTLEEQAKTICAECGSVWEDRKGPRKVHPVYSLNDWITAIANKDTRLGYWEWIATRIEEEAQHEQP